MMEEPLGDPLNEMHLQKQTIKQIFQSSIVDAMRMIENIEAIDSPRRSVTGAMLAICLVFFATVMSLQKFDEPLSASLITFSMATPLLCFGYLWSSYKVKPVPGYLLFVAMQSGSWIFEAIGGILVFVGIIGVIVHLSHAAVIAWLLSIIFVLFWVPIFSLVGLMIYAIVKFKQKPTNAPE